MDKIMFMVDDWPIIAKIVLAAKLESFAKLVNH